MMLHQLMLLVTCTACRAGSRVKQCPLSIMCFGSSSIVQSRTSLMVKSSNKGKRLGSSRGGLHLH